MKAKNLKVGDYFKRSRGKYVYKCLDISYTNAEPYPLVLGKAFTKKENYFKFNDEVVLADKEEYDLQVLHKKVVEYSPKKREKSSVYERPHVQGIVDKSVQRQIIDKLMSAIDNTVDNTMPNARIEDSLSTNLDDIIGADKMSKRVVKVYIVDKDDRLRGKYINKSLVYVSENIVTSESDEEVVMQLDIATILNTHNEIRSRVVDLELTRQLGRETFLEEIEVRDLDIRVVRLA